MYKSEEQWEQNGIDYKEWHNVPEKDIAYYDYADYTEERYPLSPENGIFRTKYRKCWTV